MAPARIPASHQPVGPLNPCRDKRRGRVLKSVKYLSTFRSMEPSRAQWYLRAAAPRPGCESSLLHLLPLEIDDGATSPFAPARCPGFKATPPRLRRRRRDGSFQFDQKTKKKKKIIITIIIIPGNENLTLDGAQTDGRHNWELLASHPGSSFPPAVLPRPCTPCQPTPTRLFPLSTKDVLLFFPTS